jgi:hypothetical protein
MDTLVIKWKIPNKKWERSKGPLIDLLFEVTDDHDQTVSDVEFIISKPVVISHYESTEQDVSWVTTIESSNVQAFTEVKDFYTALIEKYKNLGITISMHEEV